MKIILKRIENHRKANALLIEFKIKSSLEIKIATCAFEKIINDENRFYHSWENHIYPMLQTILSKKYSSKIEKIYFWAAIFHDVIYNVRNAAGQNEIKSEKFWIDSILNSKLTNLDYYEDEEDFKYEFHKDIISKVSEIIKATYGHESIDLIVREFLKLDLSGFKNSFEAIKNELLIRKEFAHIEWTVYCEGRKKFLELYSKNSIIKEMEVEQNLLLEIKYIDSLIPNIAIYPGSFNPFHVGHLDILEKAEAIFDKVIIVYAENSDKSNICFSIPPETLKNRQIEFVSGSLVKWIEALSYPVTIVRGLRNTSDVQYEQNYLRWLSSLSKKKLKVVNIFCDKENEHISSKAINSLIKIDLESAKKYIV